MHNQELIDRVAQYDQCLAEEVADALHEVTLKSKINSAEQRLSEASCMASCDPTGQDTEELQNAAAADLIAARDDLDKYQDPDGYAERLRGA